MRSIPLAMTWEMLQRGKWSLLGALLAGNALPGMILMALRSEGALDPDDRSMIVIHMTMVLINAMVLATATLSAQGNPSRLYAYPVPSSVIAAGHILPTMATMALGSLASTFALNAVFHLHWPLWGPAIFVAVATAAFLGGIWFTEKSPWYMFVIVVATMSLVSVWFNTRYGFLTYFGPPRMWLEVTPAEFLTMLAMAIAAYFAAVAGISRSRCGEFMKTPRFFQWLGSVFDVAPPVGLPFHTPAQAQFWFEWRQKGWAMPAEVLLVVPFGLCGWLIFNRNPQDLFDVFLGGGGFLTIGALVVGLVMGNAGTADGKLEMGNFLATRPMASTEMARTMLKTAGISVLAAWAIWAAAFLVIYVILLATGVAPRPELPRELGWWYFPVTLAGAWLTMSVLATIGQAGRPTLFMILFCGAMVLFIANILISKYVLSHDQQWQRHFQQGSVIGAGAILMLGSAWAFAAARRRLLIGSPTVYLGAGIWAALTALVALEGVQHPERPLPLSVLIVGLIALAVAPLAAAPLALAWNRNR